MNGTTLKALRTLLFFTQAEAAELIGNVSERSWKYWEADGRAIPDDVFRKFCILTEWRKNAIESGIYNISGQWQLFPPHRITPYTALIYYNSLDDWLSLTTNFALYWKPYNSVIAELCANTKATIIPFNADRYFKWLGLSTDSDDMRNAWADKEQNVELTAETGKGYSDALYLLHANEVTIMAIQSRIFELNSIFKIDVCNRNNSDEIIRVDSWISQGQEGNWLHYRDGYCGDIVVLPLDAARTIVQPDKE